MKKLILILFGIFLLISLASALTISNVNIKEIQPGEKTTLEFEIENTLNEEIIDVYISLNFKDVPFAPYQDSNQRAFEKIKEDGSRALSFDIISFAEAESGTYKIPIEMSYMQNEIKKTETGMISIIINALPKIEVSSDSALIKGKNNELSIKIINSGFGEAKLLSLKIMSVQGMKIVGSDVAYIGNLDSDDFDTIEFKVSISGKASSIMSVPVELDYMDSRNNKIEEDKEVMIKTYTEKEAVKLGLAKKSNTFLIIIIIAVLIVLFLIYRAIKKRLRKKSLE